MPLDKFWKAEPAAFRSAWSSDILSAAKWKGELYGLPIWGGTYGEIYNRDMVVKAGLDPAKPPKTIDEYVARGKKLTGDDHWALAVLGGKTDTTTRVRLRWVWHNGGAEFIKDRTVGKIGEDPTSRRALRH